MESYSAPSALTSKAQSDGENGDYHRILAVAAVVAGGATIAVAATATVPMSVVGGLILAVDTISGAGTMAVGVAQLISSASTANGNFQREQIERVENIVNLRDTALREAGKVLDQISCSHAGSYIVDIIGVGQSLNDFNKADDLPKYIKSFSELLRSSLEFGSDIQSNDSKDGAYHGRNKIENEQNEDSKDMIDVTKPGEIDKYLFNA